jgi:hypothetical protein
MAEIWKDIPGYEGRYQASTEGRIRSVDHVEHCTPRNGKRPYSRFRKGQVLSTCRGSNGYPCVGLRKTQDAENATFCLVFHLVALTFLGPRPEGTVICHSDGNKFNNVLTNLRYDTGTENHLDLYRQGGKYGKLSTEQARDVKRRLSRGESKNSIAKRYGISRTAVRYIAKGEHFGWLNT